MNLTCFKTQNPNEVSLYKNIPIGQLDAVRGYLKDQGLTIKIRYRGGRTQVGDIRPYSRRMQDCTRRFADRFAVYLRKDRNVAL